jgi:hypothetical protein
MKLLYLPLLIILYLAPMVGFADPIDKVADLIRQGNIHELANLFAASVEISVLNDENVYTKAQSEIILDKFFNQNKPKSVKMLHKVTSNPNFRFGVLIMTTENETFRITFTFKETDGNLMLIEFRVETEKVK